MGSCRQCGSWSVAGHNHRKAIGWGYSATVIIVAFNHILCSENISDTSPCGNGYQTCIILSCIAFNALTKLVGHREEHAVCKNWVMRCWCGYLSGASADCLQSKCRLFAYGPADATAIPKPRHLLPDLNPEWFYLSDVGLPRLSWKRGH